MTTKEIFASRKEKYEAQIRMNELEEKLYDFLIKCDVRDKQAADISFGFYIDRILKGKEFNEEEKSFVADLEKEYINFKNKSY